MYRSFFFFLLLLILTSCSSHKSLLEKHYAENTDQYWSNLVNKSEQEKISLFEVLKKENPHLHKQIEEDAKDTHLLSFWGKSLNFDSGAKKQIISDNIITDLHSKFHLKIDKKIVHAGITHSYGYLFSVLNTPYGFKRKRWIAPTLNYGFALSGNSLSPETTQGGLLSNVTYFAGKIAFKSESEKARLDHLGNVSDEIRYFDYKKLDVKFIEEEINHSHLSLRTALVKLPFKRSDEENEYWLIYTLLNQKDRNEVLITAFPIKRDAYNKITDAADLGKNRLIAVRYNAYVAGLMDQKLMGTRKIH